MGWAGRVDKLIAVQRKHPIGPSHERLFRKRRCQNLLYLCLTRVAGKHDVKPLGLKAREYLWGAVG